MRISFLILLIPLSQPLVSNALDCPEGSQLVGLPPPNGKEQKCVLADGSLHGPYKYWYSNGQLMQQLNYQHNQEHGEQRAWWPNGEKMMQGISVNGKRYQGFQYWDNQGRASDIKFETVEESSL